MSEEIYHTFLSQFETIEDSLLHLLEGINRALTITWHTTRIDLIEKFSLDKDLCQKTLNLIVGHPRTPTDLPTGLYDLLDKRLGEVYGSPMDSSGLKDEDSPFEALGKLSIWHLEDYWNCGLLPKVSEKEGLQLDTTHFSEEVCENHKIKLIQEVQKNLELLGLFDVKSFKNNAIWSANLFRDYVEFHKSLLHS